MASRSLGVLTIDLIAKVGGFIEGMDKAQREAQRKSQQIAKAVGVATGALTTMAFAAAGVGVAWTKEVAQLAVEVDKFAQLSGTTSEQFQKLALGANTAGISAEKLADIFKDVQDKVGDFMQTGGGGMADFFENIAPKVGVTAEQFRKLSGPDALQLYVTSLEKANLSQSDMVFYMEAIASDATALIPLLQNGGKAFGELGEYAERVGAVMSDDLIRASKELKTEMSMVDIALMGVKNTIASQLIPQVLESTRAFRDWITDGTRVEVVSNLISGAFDLMRRGIALLAGTVRTLTLGFIAAAEGGTALWKAITFDWSGAKESLANAKVAAQMTAESFRETWTNSFGDKPLPVPVAAVPGGAPSSGRLSPRFTKPAGGGGGDDPFRSALDAQMKSIDRLLSRERDMMQERNRFLELYNDQGIYSIQEYYDKQAQILAEGTASQVKAYDDQIKALRDYIAKTPKPQDRSRAEEQINDILDKQAKLQRDAGNAAMEAGFKQKKSAEDALKAYRDIEAQLLDLQGKSGEAARIRLGDQFSGVEQMARANGRDDVLSNVERIKQLGVAQADLNKLTNEYQFIQEGLGIQESRLALAQQTGSNGELENLVKLGEARRASYEQLKGISDEYSRIAQASGDPNMVLGAERLKLQLDELGATLDPLADKINTMFGEGFADAFGSIIDGTKTVKEAFTDMINDIMSQLMKMAVQDVFKKLIGGSSGSGGGSGFDIGALISALFGGQRANGGPVSPNKLYQVNERGPELFNAANGAQFLMTGNQSGSITPNHMLGGGTNNFYVSVPQQTSRATGAQIAAEAARKLEMSRRNM